jgi:hypothetical protein
MPGKSINKHAILVIFKETGEKYLFSSIKKFVEVRPEYSEFTLYNYTSRKKTAYEDQYIRLEKIPYFKDAEGDPSQKVV